MLGQVLPSSSPHFPPLPSHLQSLNTQGLGASEHGPFSRNLSSSLDPGCQLTEFFSTQNGPPQNVPQPDLSELGLLRVRAVGEGQQQSKPQL